ncbi:glycogen/starch/alpha-glucan phosphorylase, partial [Methylobacterium hispanicum]
GYRGIDRDITEREAANERLRHAARHDSLTELPNRLYLREHLEVRLGGAGAGCCALAIDLDRFIRPLTDDLRHRDQYLLTCDFDDYWRAQREIDAAWNDPRGWWKRAIHNTARMAWFSSDRSMREYAEEIWRVKTA